ncbi:hypothetical protein OG943_03345 [Amycolatopsis sp. NBC_00345]|uniref:glycoside hydrolase family 2 protein n=1 Tax=Amycolatopsis sp. NBC_00345 TaxID=2975955 RepID=UPI002E26222C
MRKVLPLDGWGVTETGRDDWLPAPVPGTVHEALLAAGRIPDPHLGTNEDDVQWVGERDWTYRCAFDLPDGFGGAPSVALCLDGLDTFATVTLNGSEILVCDNMFVPHRVDVRDRLRPTGNELEISFQSAWRRGKERESAGGVLGDWSTGDASRMWVRKAGYHYGWDWGPTLITAGPWQAVRLEAYDAAITSVTCPIEVTEDLTRASVPVRVGLDTAEREGLTLRAELSGPDGALLAKTDAGLDEELSFDVVRPRLWWPRGHGAADRYRLTVTVLRDGAELDRRELHVGIRRVRLVQEPLDGHDGTGFHFEINNRPVFCGGANWIPADSFTPRITAGRYRDLLTAAADANLAMIRVWGGGIYEPDLFYDLCDELGLTVWQDFMFACGQYPAPDWMTASVAAEAEAAVARLQHHPSIVLWCGNNEDYSLAREEGRYPVTEESAFPARAYYEELLPAIVAAADPHTPYWPGSPYPDEDTRGDQHIWDVWHGEQARYQDYARFPARFVSEFGMQSFPAPETLDACIPVDERHLGSRTLEHRNKAVDGPRRLASYVADNFGATAELDAYRYRTQLVQAEAMTCAIHAWRRQWQGAGRRVVSGALAWQLNDCWPAISWALIDHLGFRKPAYYAIRRALAPVAIGLADGGTAWAVNDTPHDLSAELVVEIAGLNASGAEVVHRAPCLLPAGRAVELGTIPHLPADVVIQARLEADTTVLAGHTRWPEPHREHPLADPDLQVTVLDQNAIRLTARRPAKGVWVPAPRSVAWSDNLVDLLPGRPRTLTGQDIAGAVPRIEHLAGSIPKSVPKS